MVNKKVGIFKLSFLFIIISFFKKTWVSQAQWHMSVIQATWETELVRIVVQV
jgi:hypothetical protein